MVVDNKTEINTAFKQEDSSKHTSRFLPCYSVNGVFL